MEIFIYVLLYIVLCFFAGLIIVTFCSTEKVSSLSIFEITKYGFYSLSFIVMLIAVIVITLIK
jgi:hypothetical protein